MPTNISPAALFKSSGSLPLAGLVHHNDAGSQSARRPDGNHEPSMPPPSTSPSRSSSLGSRARCCAPAAHRVRRMGACGGHGPAQAGRKPDRGQG
jgi:hypothetical protein